LWKRLTTRIIVRLITGVITVSDFNRRCHKFCRAFPESRTVTIYKGVDPDAQRR
jgi:hypothetical protein